MAIGNDKCRILITLTKEDKDKFEILAKQDNRNLSNWIYNIVKNHVEQQKD